MFRIGDYAVIKSVVNKAATYTMNNKFFFGCIIGMILSTTLNIIVYSGSSLYNWAASYYTHSIVTNQSIDQVVPHVVTTVPRRKGIDI